MRIASFVSAVAVATAVSIVSASAAERFSVMKNIPIATALTAQQLDDVVGKGQPLVDFVNAARVVGASAVRGSEAAIDVECRGLQGLLISPAMEPL